MTRVLVIIDMQSHFPGSKVSRIKSSIKALIFGAKIRNERIFVVEYDDFSWAKNWGPTLSDISSLVSDYDKTFWLRKREDDGSREIRNLLVALNLSSDELVLCGVNAGACVLRTTRGLLKKGYRVVIPEEATCNDPSWAADSYLLERHGKDGLKQLRQCQEANSDQVRLTTIDAMRWEI